MNRQRRLRCTFCGQHAGYRHDGGAVTYHALVLNADPSPICCQCFDSRSLGTVLVGDTCPNPLHRRHGAPGEPPSVAC